jgi:WD40 repeat protein
LENHQLLWTIEGHGDIVQSVALDARGSMLLSGSRDRTLKIWHPGRGELLSTLTGHTSGVTSVAISPDSFTLASGSQDKTIKIWRFQ